MSARYGLLDAFRGVAILWIVAYHLLPKPTGAADGFFSELVGSGFLGVAVFLVISGFGLSAASTPAIAGKTPVRLFLLRRLQRVYLPFLLSVALVGGVLPLLRRLLPWFAQAGRADLSPNWSVGEWLSFLGLYRIFSSTTWDLWKVFEPVNSVYWYLAILVQIYLVYAVLLALFRQHVVVAVAVVALLSLLGVSSRLNIHIPKGLFLPYWFTFALGVGLHELVRRGWECTLFSRLRGGWKGLPVAGYFMAAAVAVHWMMSHYPYRYYIQVFSVVLAILLWMLHTADRSLSNLLPVKMLAFIGAFAYSIYLVHGPVSAFLNDLWAGLVPENGLLRSTGVQFVLVLGFSYLWYRLIERPITSRRVFAGEHTADSVVIPACISRQSDSPRPTRVNGE